MMSDCNDVIKVYYDNNILFDTMTKYIIMREFSEKIKV